MKKRINLCLSLLLVATMLPNSIVMAKAPNTKGERTRYSVKMLKENSTEADKAAAKAVEDKINAIGEVVYTKECDTKIKDAQKSYNALTESQKALVPNLETLEKALGKYSELKTEYRQQTALAGGIASDLIKLGEITLEDKEAIKNLRSRYEALGPVGKEYFKNMRGHNYFADLEEAEAKIAELEKAEADKAAAKAVEDKINAIGEVVYTKECDTKIKDAQKSYNALTESQKALVPNLETLEKALGKYSELKTEYRQQTALAGGIASDLIKLGEITLEDKEAIKNLRSRYEALGPVGKEYFKNMRGHNYLADLEAAETKIAELEKAEADKAAAKAVEDKINAIGEVEYTPECKAKIVEAQKAYKALTKEQKKLVTNINVWEEANKKYHELELAHQEELSKVRDLAQRVIDLGEITLEDKVAIEAIRKDYEALKPFAQEYFQNYYGHDYLADLVAAETKIAELEKAEADKAAAKAVEDKINAIGEVEYTPECKAKIVEAQKAYRELTKEQQKLVTNIKVWEEANKKYHELELAHQEELSKVRDLAQRVIDLGEITLEDKVAIEAIRKDYEALKPFAQEYFQNYYGYDYLADLVAAEAKIAELEKTEADKAAAKAVEDKINAIGTVTLESETAIKAARTAYDNLTDDQKVFISPETLKILTDAEAKYAELMAKPEVDPETKPEVDPETKPEIKPEVRPELPEVKPVVKPENESQRKDEIPKTSDANNSMLYVTTSLLALCAISILRALKLKSNK